MFCYVYRIKFIIYIYIYLCICFLSEYRKDEYYLHYQCTFHYRAKLKSSEGVSRHSYLAHRILSIIRFFLGDFMSLGKFTYTNYL